MANKQVDKEVLWYVISRTEWPCGCLKVKSAVVWETGAGDWELKNYESWELGKFIAYILVCQM